MTGDINLMNVDHTELPLAEVAGALGAADAVFANLECMLHRPPEGCPEGYEGFYADPDVATAALKQANLGAVGVANNVNYGHEAILGSISALDGAGVPHSGAGVDLAEARRPAIIGRRGVRYGFLQRSSVYWATNHAAAQSSPGIAVLPGHTAYEAPMYQYDDSTSPPNRPGIPPRIVTWADQRYLDEYADDIRRLKSEVDVVIASHHWGWRADVLDYMTQIAHAAIDAGADIVMGHGPHSPLPVGFHRGRPIFYGLGSFSFHTGHQGVKHGNWIGLLGRLDRTQGGDRISFRLVRHDDANRTVLRTPSEERETVDSLERLSRAHGALLTVDGDEIVMSPA
jgi:poly-gamma-glutamate synthesis protein (capsule biosynthesis protein)